MIKKDKLLSAVNSLIDMEKRLIPLLSRHIASSLFLSGLDKKAQGEIVERFQKAAVTGTKHVELLEGIKDEVTRGTADVY